MRVAVHESGRDHAARGVDLDRVAGQGEVLDPAAGPRERITPS